MAIIYVHTLADNWCAVYTTCKILSHFETFKCNNILSEHSIYTKVSSCCFSNVFAT